MRSYQNIWKEMISDYDFIDLNQKNKNKESYDIILPLKNSTPLFKENLFSWYRNININSILVGDAGSGDDSIDIIKNFPRVKIFDHKKFLTSGFSIKKLIEEVGTKYFFHFHCDVFVNNKTIDPLINNKDKADWIEGSRIHTILFAEFAKNYDEAERSFSGVQFGNSERLKKATENLEDGYCQRSEDIVIAEMVKNSGFSFYKNTESVHYHQMMNKKSYSEPEITNVKITKKTDPIYEVRAYKMQTLGIIKYCKPKKYLIEEVAQALFRLKIFNVNFLSEAKKCAKENNIDWLSKIKERPQLGFRVIFLFDYILANRRNLNLKLLLKVARLLF
jgi:hypothetical protein